MKKIIGCICIIGVVFLLCCCGNVELQNGSSKDISSQIEKNQINNHVQESDIVTETIEIKEVILAKEFLSRILYVSEEWLPGQYVVVGISMEGEQCCGILNTEGEFFELSGYTVIYPLAEGKLLATDQPEAPITFDIGTYEEMVLDNASVVGKIIDAEGNVVFEYEEGYMRMIPVNSHSIMAFEARASLEGFKIKCGVLNQNGEWLIPLGSGGMLASHLQDKIYIESDGISWNFKDSFFAGAKLCNNCVNFGCVLNDKDSGLLQFTTGTGSLVYNARTGRVFNISTYYPLTEMSYDLLGGANVFYDANGYEKALLLDGKVLGTMDYMYMSYEGSVYKDGNWIPYFTNKLDENHNLLTLFGEHVEFDDQVKTYFKEVKGFYENRVVILLKGADKRIYITATDFIGNKLFEPICLTDYAYDYDGLCGQYYFYISLEDCIHAVDVETGNIITGIESEKYSSMDMVNIKQISENRFAVCWENEYDDLFYNIYQINNELINRIY